MHTSRGLFPAVDIVRKVLYTRSVKDLCLGLPLEFHIRQFKIIDA
jgi:hypothetical protein